MLDVELPIPACAFVPSAVARLLNRDDYRRVIDGHQVDLFTLANRNGLVAQITNHGARLVQMIVPDARGHADNVVLGYDTLDALLAGQISAGATIGRFAGRIADARFTLGGIEHRLTANENANHLHGGANGASRRVFDVVTVNPDSVSMQTVFPHGQDGYPGEMTLNVTYRLGDDNALAITMTAQADRPTIVNLMHHSFWNLSGDFSEDAMHHHLTLNAARYLPMRADFVPDGRILPVAGTPFDFRTARSIASALASDDSQLRLAGGYGHGFLLDPAPTGLRFAARLAHDCSGRVMMVSTTEPALHLNTANGLRDRDLGKGKQHFGRRSAITLQPMHPSNGPN